jgi:hypothetical protein
MLYTRLYFNKEKTNPRYKTEFDIYNRVVEEKKNADTRLGLRAFEWVI